MTVARPYQSAGVSFLTSRNGAILGDQVGLGKTLVAIQAVQRLELKRVLVVAPKVLKPMWQEAILAEEPGFVEENPAGVVRIHTRGTPRLWTITHYEQYNVRSKIRSQLQAHKWDAVIVDEVHNLTNTSSQRASGIHKLKSDYRWGLTGTPVRDRPPDLWGLLRWVAPDYFTSKWRFITQNFETNPGMFGGVEVGSPKDAGALARQTSPYLLIRTWEDVRPYFAGEAGYPQILDTIDVPIVMTTSQAKLYGKLENDMFVRWQDDGLPDPDLWDFSARAARADLLITNAIARFTHMHRCASYMEQLGRGGCAKCDWLDEYVAGGGDPAVVFTRYRATADMLRGVLGSQFIVGTYAGMSQGLNLQDRHVVILWDESFSRLDHEQAIGRVYRQGQLYPVLVYRLGTLGTVDEDLRRMIDNKQELVQAVVDAYRAARRKYEVG